MHARQSLFRTLLFVAFTTAALHAQDTLRGMGPINGYTGVVFNTTSDKYDYLVDSSLPQDDPATKRFRTVEGAYAAAPAGTVGHPTVIGIKPDVYLLPGKGLNTGLAITKNNITLLGLTDDRRKVVLADNRGNQEGAGVLGNSNNGYTMTVKADGFSAINLTIINFCNMDYEYPGNPAKNLKMRSPVVTQAVAFDVQGDRHFYSHVAFLSRLDTMFIRTTRSYFTNAYAEGTDDFLGGGTVGVWKDSEIYFPTGNGVMSASGITFINTVFRASKGLEFYKGTRNPVTLIDCVLPANTAAAPIAWMVWKAPLRQNLYSLTYRVKNPDGKPAQIVDSIVGAPRFTMSRELSAEEMQAFNPWNLLHAIPGGAEDSWDPAGVRAQYEPLGAPVFRMNVAARSLAETATAATPAALALASPFGTPTPGNATIRTGGPGVKLSATVMPAAASAASLTWSSPSPLVDFSIKSGPATTVTGRNTTQRAEWVPVRATAPNGFYVTSYLYVEPAFIPSPTLAAAPRIEKSRGTAIVRYDLGLRGKEDQSRITWSTCADRECANLRPVAVSRGDQPLIQLPLTAGMVGKYLRVVVEPKHNISDAGPGVTAISAQPVAASDVTAASVTPHFRNFVETENKSFENGMWTVLGTFTSSTGEELTDGYGLRVSSAGTTLAYQNDGPVGDMTVNVTMTPEKTAGQGFGIPGSSADDEKVQRADLFIKYDPRTRTGYSLRFWRTTQSGEKCMFQLFRITEGKGTPLNDEQQLTGVFKPQTLLTLSVRGSTLSVTGSNSVDAEKLSLTAQIQPNPFGGAGAYWSGSVPLGNSVTFSRFDITYPTR